MSKVSFNLVTIRDFMSIESVTLPYEEGTRLLLGHNRDSSGADDNGSGKSSLFEALRWALYGETVKQTMQTMTAEHVVRRGAKKASVSVKCTIDGVGVLVSRTRTKSSGSLKLMIDADEFSGKGAQVKLEELLGIDKVQFSNLVYLVGSYPKLFASATDQDRKAILAELVEVAIVSKMQEEVKARITPLALRIEHLKSEIVGLESKQDTLRGQQTRVQQTAKEDRAELKESKRELKNLKAALVVLKKDALAADKKLAEAEGKCLEALNQANEDIAATGEVIEELASRRAEVLSGIQLERDELVRRAAQLQATLKTVSAEKARVEGLISSGSCPTCGQETEGLEVEVDESLVHSTHGKLQDTNKALAELKERAAAVHEQHQLARDCQISERNRLRQEVKDLKVRYEVEEFREEAFQADSSLNTKRQEEVCCRADVQARITSLERAKEVYLRMKTDVADCKGKIQRCQEIIKKLEQEVEQLAFWRTGFGSRGVPSLYIETVLPHISGYIQQYADILSGGDITVTLQAFSETKSNTIKEAIQIVAKNAYGADLYGANSTGERHRIDLAVTLGLVKYFKDMGVFESNLLICDEIFDGLDQTGVEAAHEALRQAGISSTWVISHHDRLVPLFENVSRMIKENGTSWLER